MAPAVPFLERGWSMQYADLIWIFIAMGATFYLGRASRQSWINELTLMLKGCEEAISSYQAAVLKYEEAGKTYEQTIKTWQENYEQAKSVADDMKLSLDAANVTAQQAVDECKRWEGLFYEMERTAKEALDQRDLIGQ